MDSEIDVPLKPEDIKHLLPSDIFDEIFSEEIPIENQSQYPDSSDDFFITDLIDFLLNLEQDAAQNLPPLEIFYEVAAENIPSKESQSQQDNGNTNIKATVQGANSASTHHALSSNDQKKDDYEEYGDTFQAVFETIKGGRKERRRRQRARKKA